MLDHLTRDLRHTFRTFARHPGFALIAVVTIALGIGANTAIFSVVQAVLLRPLPYADADRLVLINGALTNRNIEYWATSPPDLRAFQEQVTRLDELEAVWTFTQPMTSAGADPEQVTVGAVTPGFLGMLGARAAAGRLFLDEDAAPIAPDTAPNQGPPSMIILSPDLWERRFGRDPGVIGRSVNVGNDAIVVGVLQSDLPLYMPAQTGLATDIDVWIAPRLNPNAPGNNVFLRMVGRLAPGATIEQAQAQVNQVVDQIRADRPSAATAGLRQTIVPMHEDVTREGRPVILALLGAVGLVLLIACANVSNLLLVRASVREREIAVRAALGGSRAAIVRQILTESVVLATAGAVVGVLLSLAGIRLLLALQPPDLPRLATVSLDGVVLAYTALAALVAALMFGAAPALQASRGGLIQALKDRGASAAGHAQTRLRNAVVVLEVALSLVLLIGAGLMLRTFVALNDVDPGYDPNRVLTFGVQLPIQRYPTPEHRLQFISGLRERLAALPGVASAGAAGPLPLSGAVSNGPYGTEEVLADPEKFQQAEVRIVTEDYFTAMGTGVVDGRVFTDADRSSDLRYVVIDDTLARRTWPNERAVGKRLMVRLGGPDYVPVEVLGVVEHQRSVSLASEGRETLYYHDAAAGGPGGLTWVVRTDGDPQSLVESARRALADLDPLLPMTDVRTMREYVDDAMAPTRFALVLIAIFGATALALASIGLYGVLAYAVRQRTSEIGVRMALGAAPAAILRMVVGEGLRLTIAGIGVGLVAALALTRVLRNQLVDVEPTDPVTFAATSVLFLGIAALACAVPARRATRVNPLTALRED